MSSSQNINNHFFEGLYKEVWRTIIPPALTDAECDFIQEIADLKPGDQVLDIMCGYGRHSIELAKRNFKVTAIDNLQDYIDEVSELSTQEELGITAMAGDIMQLSLNHGFKAAICMGNSFAFFNGEEALTLLKKISKSVVTGGVFIINSWMIAEIAIKFFKQYDWHYSGPYKCILENNYLFHPSRIETEQTIIAPNGQVEIIKGVDYIFTLNELEQMLNLAGLRTVGLYSTPRKKKFTLGDGRIYIVAEKV
jgi:2-polyprenyl-3-methyl-5-hydroxy-6-metoxy-1,4-benzoquinol methylase